MLEKTEIQILLDQIHTLSSLVEKEAYLSTQGSVRAFFLKHSDLVSYFNSLPIEQRYVLQAVVVLGQGEQIFAGWQNVQDRDKVMGQLLQTLCTVEHFYDYLGGIIGYHLKTIELMYAGSTSSVETEEIEIAEPPYIDIRTESKESKMAVSKGILALDSMAEVYVVGGAGDRLKLVDEKTNEPLPVAALEFGGKSLLKRMIEDLQAREFLFYKLTGKKITVPIVLMTSLDKNNDACIEAICESESYFGRPKNSIFRLLQPLAPVITIDGDWAVRGPLELVLKPGGHGVLWKLAKDAGAFDWLKECNKTFCIVRQINNPMAGLDNTLLALAGVGVQDGVFGFVTCPRLKDAAEGLIVQKTVKTTDSETSSISNIEYTDFKGKISEHALYPANTNILFASLEAILKATNKVAIPGLLVNMKQPVETRKNGKMVSVPAARLESTMQNISDILPSKETFVLLGERQKIMSVTKKAFESRSILETPEGAFYDLMRENVQLLQSICQFEVPPFPTREEYMKDGPSAFFSYHPALGPLYSIIAQKVAFGTFVKGAELQLEIQELILQNLYLDGTLRISAKNIVGARDPSSSLIDFGTNVGSAILENVRVINRGIDTDASNCYWKNQIVHKEACQIILEGNSQFIARNVTLAGDMVIRVSDGMQATALCDESGSLVIQYEPKTEENGFSWQYNRDEQGQISLSSC
jgi:UDP-N-acetylglucosamine pyrophosphorylase